MSKGDTPRPVNKERYDENYRRVFGVKRLNVWEDAPGREPEDRTDSGPIDGVLEEPRGRVDSEAPDFVEGEETV